jgi:serine/threonine protein phosphatase PrpC
VLACDGVWDVLSNQEVVEFVKVQYSMYKNLNYVAKLLAQEAIDK